jgi:hypothetical protein
MGKAQAKDNSPALRLATAQFFFFLREISPFFDKESGEF